MRNKRAGRGQKLLAIDTCGSYRPFLWAEYAAADDQAGEPLREAA